MRVTHSLLGIPPLLLKISVLFDYHLNDGFFSSFELAAVDRTVAARVIHATECKTIGAIDKLIVLASVTSVGLFIIA